MGKSRGDRKLVIVTITRAECRMPNTLATTRN